MRQGKARVLKPTEFDVLLKVTAAGSFPIRNAAMLYLSHGCGLRVGEIASMKVGTVCNADFTIKEELVLLKQNTKTKKSRTVYLTSTKVVGALKEYVAEICKTGNPTMETVLFKSAKGHRMSGNALQQVFARLYKMAGFEGCKSHTGRRTFATRLARNGADLKSIKTLMGHESITMTAQYVEDNPDILKSVAAKAV